MEYFFLKGFLLVLFTQYCTTEGLSSSLQSSMVVMHQDGQTLPQESELPPAEVVPVVAPPSLKEVQQAVLEASEQVEGRGAEEVLKELLERVVEAAMVQQEGKADEEAVQEVVEEQATWTETKEAEANIEGKVVEQGVGKMLEGVDVGIKGGYIDAGGDQEGAEVDAFEDAAEKEEGIAEVEGETTAGSVEKTTAGVDTGKADGAEGISAALDTEASQGIAETEETAGESAIVGTVVEEDTMEVLSSEEKGAVETGTQRAEETPAIVDVAVDGNAEQEGLEESDSRLALADVEQEADVLVKEETVEGETQIENDVSVLPSDNHETETTETVVGETLPVEEQVNDTEGPEVKEEQGQSLVERGAAGEVGTEGEGVGEGAVGERDGDREIHEESVAVVEEGGDQQAGGEEQVTLESHGGEKADQEMLVISAPEPEDSAELSTKNQAPTLSPSLGGEETGESSPDDANHGNEIITPTDDILPHNPDVFQPTLDNTLKDVLAEPPQAEVEEPGETHELVEDSTRTTERSELGLEAWKIGAISAAVFLVLETAVIIIYILKCRNKNNTPATQRACEEGCVEPEATTGGDCSDDTLPAGNGDTQQIAALDPSDVASTLAQNNQPYKEEQAVAMLGISPSFREESANTGPGLDSSQDLRTSIL